MTIKHDMEYIRCHRSEIDGCKLDDVSRRLLADYNKGNLRIRIGEIVHDRDNFIGLPRTACDIRWVPKASDTFPQGIPTEEAVDCMSCLVNKTKPL